MDHLVCFMPGTIALGATEGRTIAEAEARGEYGEKQKKEMELARELMKTCWGMYAVTATGLAPEIVYFDTAHPPVMEKDGPLKSKSIGADSSVEWEKDYIIQTNDRHNLQRPETIESLFYMWRITGDVIYREWGWEMFRSFVNYTAVAEGTGFTSLDSVVSIPPPQRDNMESFWLVCFPTLSDTTFESAS